MPCCLCCFLAYNVLARARTHPLNTQLFHINIIIIIIIIVAVVVNL